jgi:pSer/pThr/pTyr-binding forkhead associated (FHA) protein
MARLIILARNSSVRQVNIASPITTIGRSGSNSVCIDSQRVSRHHAAIEWTGEHFMLTDMGSRNGTYVNNEKVRAHALVNGDAIVVGDCQLRFLYSRALPPVDALRLMTQPGELMGVDAHVARSLNRRLPERRVFAR